MATSRRLPSGNGWPTPLEEPALEKLPLKTDI